ncbi:major facilitator superfamily domain-containing protein [Aspergillus venezuelensis]
MPSTPAQPSPRCIALASFTNMFTVGTLYTLSILQAQLPRLFDIPQSWVYTPFTCAGLGLALGVGTCSSLVERLNARTATATGSMLWGFAVFLTGHSLAMASFGYILAALFFGGIGVGWTYLAVVVWVGENLPVSSLARTTIGPLGFSSGAAVCFTLSSVPKFDDLTSMELGTFLKLAGGGFITVGITTLALVPGKYHDTVQKPGQTSGPPSLAGTLPGSSLFQLLLFFNALPGITIFAAFLPTVKYHTTAESPYILPHYLIPLILGSILSPTLSRLLRPKPLFSTLFIFRGIALLTFAHTPSEPIFLLTLGIILFAHGVGFSTLPGVAGCVLNALLMSESDDFTPVARVLAGIVLGFAGYMKFVNF